MNVDAVKTLKRAEELLKAANVAITESGHDMTNCEGAKDCYLCEIQQDIDQYFEN